MQASIIAPIVAVMALLAKSAFGIEIGAELQEQIADAVLSVTLAVVAVFGVVKSHQDKKLTNLK
jgi:uncharacterized membrane protein